MILTVDARKSGVVVPLGALRSAESCGVGEYADLPALGQVCRKADLSFIQLLPVNDTGCMSSPYSALSAFALHPLYLRLRDLPEASAFRGEEEALARKFEGERRFPYSEILAAKLEILRRVFKAAAPSLREDKALASWIEANPWVREYAVFLNLKSSNNGKSWKEWKEHRDPSPEAIAALWSDASFRDGHLFHAWVQMRCEEQFRAASRSLTGLGIALKGDLPILMNDDSADVWAHRSWFRMDRTAGAPPDMFSELGQNWGFPTYDWDALARDGYSFWMDRLRQAAKFYGAYRIDHVLGFFRIWTIPERDESGYAGSFEPSIPITRDDLHAAGFSDERVRWLSRSHVRESALRQAAASEKDPEAAVSKAVSAALERIGGEPLFLFKPDVRGEKDILALKIPESMKAFLLASWRDRALLETESGAFHAAWRYYSASCWPTLSDSERRALEGLVGSRGAESEAVWEQHGRILLAELKKASAMLPCAEDLGAVPSCVPRVLAELGILGLRIPRWTRRWGQDGDPYIDPADYPALTVCAPSVHDTSTLRDWWENEAGSEDRKAAYGGASPSDKWSGTLGARILSRYAKGSSVLMVAQLQDLLDLSKAYAPKNAKEGRINVPGTVNKTNWTWRMPVTLEILARDIAFLTDVKEVLAR